MLPLMAEKGNHEQKENKLPPVPPHKFIPSYLNKVKEVKRSRFYTQDEVSQHHLSTDAWVSVHSNVLSVTDLTENLTDFSAEDRRSRGTLATFAGKDISHWFKNRYPLELKQCSNFKHGGQQEYFLPQGRIPDVLPFAPMTNYAIYKPGYRKTDWWSQSSREMGKLTKKTRKIYVVNMLFVSDPSAAKPDLLKVCSEETLNEIVFRYLEYNRHAGSYTWKFEGRVLDMNKTLEENGIEDDEWELKLLDIDVDKYIPIIHVYFNDDLTVA